MGGLKPNCVLIDWPEGWNVVPTNSEPPPSTSEDASNNSANALPSVMTAGVTESGNAARPKPVANANSHMTGSIAAIQAERKLHYAQQQAGIPPQFASDPALWAHLQSPSAEWRSFVASVRVAGAAHCAVLVPRGQFPLNTEQIERGYIDVWWIVQDGGLLLLIPFLLLQNRVWRSCRLRIFTIAEIEDNRWLYFFKLFSEVFQLKK